MIANKPSPRCRVPIALLLGCLASADCASDRSRTMCDATTKLCVGCLTNADCKGATASICDTIAKTCVKCGTDAQCLARDATRPACDPSGACVACVDSKKHCPATAPICEPTTSACRTCREDAECARDYGADPGVCMSNQDGRCGTDAEAIYVQNKTGCSMSTATGGTKDAPFCLSQAGVDAVTATRRVVVMRGPDALRFWTASPSGSQVTVLGQAGATIAPGADFGIHVSSGNLFVRGLRISGGSNIGVLADGGAELHMSDCIVESNSEGGIQIDGAGYDITNTVIAKNGPGTDTGGVVWGGIRIGTAAVPTGKSSRFLNNTVVNNSAPGVSCASALSVAGSIIFGNLSGDGAGCSITACCSGDPLLTADYHLMSGSPCIDQLNPTISVSDDFDGQSRPQGASGKSDCGADEWVTSP